VMQKNIQQKRSGYPVAQRTMDAFKRQNYGWMNQSNYSLSHSLCSISNYVFFFDLNFSTPSYPYYLLLKWMYLQLKYDWIHLY
jgi:hypothetical protein